MSCYVVRVWFKEPSLYLVKVLFIGVIVSDDVQLTLRQAVNHILGGRMEHSCIVLTSPTVLNCMDCFVCQGRQEVRGRRVSAEHNNVEPWSVEPGGVAFCIYLTLIPIKPINNRNTRLSQ